MINILETETNKTYVVLPETSIEELTNKYTAQLGMFVAEIGFNCRLTHKDGHIEEVTFNFSFQTERMLTHKSHKYVDASEYVWLLKYNGRDYITFLTNLKAIALDNKVFEYANVELIPSWISFRLMGALSY